MEFRILGPLEVLLNGEPVDLGGIKPRTVLAMLLLRRGRVVSKDKLVDHLWGHDPPGTPQSTLQTYISHLRAALEPDRPRRADPQVLVTQPPGYLLRVTDDQLDATRFERLLQQGTADLRFGKAELAVTKLQEGLGLWRGSVLADFPDPAFARAEIAHLTGLRLVAKEHRVAAELALGRHRELVAPLEMLIQQHPQQESLRRLLMLALYRSGRQAEALRVYHEARATLCEELGIDPSPELRSLYQAILHQRPELDWHPEAPQERFLIPYSEPRHGPPAATSGTGVVIVGRRGELDRYPRPSLRGDQAGEDRGATRALPSGPVQETTASRAELFQLPPDLGDFVDRDVPSARLRGLLQHEGRHPSAVMISAISGKAGVGKSVFAIHIAHEIKYRFPDGQLYVNLRGLDTPVPETADVLADFLLALEVDPTDIPDGLTSRASLYRARLRGRRVLVVLDNAADEAQIRPLLPWSEGCAVLVSSRRRLAGLEGAVTLELDVMEAHQAVELLGKVAGEERVCAEPEAADEIVRLCGCLPLAVRIAGARLATKRHWRLAAFAARLRDERRRLKELRAGDLEIRASFALSYAELSPDEQRAFRLLGILDAPDFPAWVAAALLDSRLDVAEERVEQLIDAQLVEACAESQTGQIRYRFHDLLRAFARDCLDKEEPAALQRAALERALSAYLKSTVQAGTRLGRDYYRIGGSRTLRSGESDDLSLAQVVEADPLAWFNAEQDNLITAVAQAHEAGLWQLCWELADSLAALFESRAEWSAWELANKLALDATRQAADREAEAYILLSIGKVQRHLRGPEAMVRADRPFDEARAIFAALGDERGTAYARLETGVTHRYHGRFQDALAELERCLLLFRQFRDELGEAAALRNIGIIYRHRGQYEEAIDCLTRALAVFQLGNSHLPAALTLRQLGIIHRNRGHLDDARICTEQSLSLFRKIENRPGESLALGSLGKVHLRSGLLDDARACLEECLLIYRELGNRGGEAWALDGLGDLYRAEGHFEDARECYRRAVPVFQETGGRIGEADARLGLGRVNAALGLVDDAMECFVQGLHVFQESGLPLKEARTLQSIGMLLASGGDHAGAKVVWQQAYTIFRRLELPEADEVDALLRSV
ncbi:MAG: AfsR/SARP family transcriptional regulator [Egibacteraceae bacterium]